jgi:hypothetical protein
MFSQTDFNTGKATEISSEEHNSNVEKVWTKLQIVLDPSCNSDIEQVGLAVMF